MDVYTPARTVDFTDTGLWRLIIYISRKGMTALLRHVEDASQPVVRLFSTSWDADETRLLSVIESTIFDNPRVLEDYATDIIVETDRLTWVPSCLVEENEIEEDIFTTLFPTAPDDPMIDKSGELAALFCLTGGLYAFINRTIPGARVRSHIAVIADRFVPRSVTGPYIFVDIRDGEADMMLCADKRLMASATHSWNALSDIGYRVFQMADSAGYHPDSLTVFIGGKSADVATLTEILTPLCKEVQALDIVTADEDRIPLAAAILAE